MYDVRGHCPVGLCKHLSELSWLGTSEALRTRDSACVCNIILFSTWGYLFCPHLLVSSLLRDRSSDMRSVAGLCSLLMICDSPQISSDVSVPASDWSASHPWPLRSIEITWPEHRPLIGQLCSPGVSVRTDKTLVWVGFMSDYKFQKRISMISWHQWCYILHQLGESVTRANLLTSIG